MSIVTHDSTPTVEMLQKTIETLNEHLVLKTKLLVLLEDRVEYLEKGERTCREHLLRVVQ